MSGQTAIAPTITAALQKACEELASSTGAIGIVLLDGFGSVVVAAGDTGNPTMVSLVLNIRRAVQGPRGRRFWRELNPAWGDDYDAHSELFFRVGECALLLAIYNAPRAPDIIGTLRRASSRLARILESPMVQ